jgi:hypothetical protein
MIESSIIEGVENKDLITAGAGLIGVVIGGLVTAAGQHATRRHEFRQRILEQVTELCSAAHEFQTNANSQLTLLGTAPKEVIDEHSRRVNESLVAATKCGNTLSVLASGPIQRASVQVVNRIVEAQDYLHPALGDGRAEAFVNREQYLNKVSSARNTLIKLARRRRFMS